MALSRGSTALASDHNATYTALRRFLTDVGRTVTALTVRIGDTMNIGHYTRLAADYDTGRRAYDAGCSSACSANHSTQCSSNRSHVGTDNSGTCNHHAHCPADYRDYRGGWVECGTNYATHYGRHYNGNRTHNGTYKVGGY